MISYQETPVSPRSDVPGPQTRFSDQRSPAQVAQIIGMLAWFTVSMMTLFYLSRLSERSLDLARSHTGSTALWFQPDTWVIIAFLVPTMLAIVVLLLRLQPITKLTTLILLFAAMVGAAATAMTGYVMATGDQVLIHSPLPWRHDVRFRLADARVTAKGCHLSRSKSGTHHHIIFKVQGGPAGSETVDLGAAAARDLGTWLAIMQAYDNGSLPLPAEASANAAHDTGCIQFWLTDLDPQQRPELDHLLS
ncbi:MAG: hypothetical protein ACRYFW_14845 [Janthinobacterium lividum]